MKILITGGAGFIGSNLVRACLAKGWSVRVLDNFATGRRENLQEVRGDVELVEGDIRSYHIVNEAVRGCDAIAHQAALPSVPRSIKDPITTNEVNVQGTLNILEAAVKNNVRRVVNASSSSVYGSNPQLPKVETMVPQPMSPYATSKLAAEHYCQVFHRLYDIEAISLRYFNVFGPRQDPQSEYAAVIPRFIKAIGAGDPITVFGGGTQTRDFTFVENVVAANLLAVTSPLPKEQDASVVCNIGCGDRVVLNDMVTLLERSLGKKADRRHQPSRPGDVPDSQASIERAKSLIGYVPVVNFEEGLARTAAWYRGASEVR